MEHIKTPMKAYLDEVLKKNTLNMQDSGEQLKCHECGANTDEFQSICADCKKNRENKEIEKAKLDYQRRLIYMPDKYIRIIGSMIETPRSVYLHGKCGTGKTVIACAIAKAYALLKLGSFVYFYSCPSLIMSLQTVAKRKDEYIDDYLDKIANCDCILLDDLGAEKMTDFVRQSLYMIINHREQHELSTIITSNYNLEQISEQIDTRIASRIAGMCEVIGLKGKDKRLQEKTSKVPPRLDDNNNENNI